MSDYTHDDAMRDPADLTATAMSYLDTIDAGLDVCRDEERSIAAYIERLEAQARLREADFWTTQADRDEWEAVARWLAHHSVDCHWERDDDDPRGLVEWTERLPDVGDSIIAAAEEAVRHE